MENKPEYRVTLEELLRVKRSEQPAPEFWTEFEAQLRQKQLAAAVAKRPWWFGLSQAFVGLSRYQLPAGAAAVLAVTFLTVREYREPGFEAAVPNSELAVAASVGAVPSVKYRETSEVAYESSSRSAYVSSVARETTPSPERVVERASEDDAQFASSMPWGVGGVVAQQTPSARSIAANLAAADVSWAAELGLGQEDAARLSRSNRSEPLAQVVSPNDLRRQRLFAYVAEPSAAQLAGEERTGPGRERLASRLSDQELYESVRRMSAGGDRLTLKF